jgi:transposase
MPKKLAYMLSGEQVRIIESAMAHEKNAEVVRRTTAIHLLHLGHSPNEVAQMMATSLSTIYNWHHRWAKRGIEGLVNQPKSGRPPRVTISSKQERESS